MLNSKLIDGYALPIYHSGPPLQDGPLPTMIYFATTGEESLSLDPYCQPAVFLADKRIRVISLTLPGHGLELENSKAIAYWATHLAAGDDIITQFTQECRQAIDFLISQDYIQDSHLAVAGLSRGAFIAAHLAAADPRIKTVLGFSPLTRLDTIAEFKQVQQQQLIQALSLTHLTEHLADKTVRYYIGNRDTRVSTEHCFAFIQALTEAAYAHKHRSPPIEMVIYPSIGHKGHGTSPNIFLDGVNWLASHLNLQPH